jgi:hypothetical protein
VGENYFELSITPFPSLHPIFNVELLHPYFPPLLETLDATKHLDATKINPNYIEHVTFDRIIDTRTCQFNIQLYWVIKAGKLLH